MIRRRAACFLMVCAVAAAWCAWFEAAAARSVGRASASVAAVAAAEPERGKVVFQAFWWDCENQRYPGDWYTYLAKLVPRLKALGVDAIYLPPPSKGNSGTGGMGYDLFDHYDLGNKRQKGSVGTRFGDQDALLRLIAVAHANGLDVHLDIVLNHVVGGRSIRTRAATGTKRFRYVGFGGAGAGRWPKSWLDFHPNPDHDRNNDDWTGQMFGPDACYRFPCSDRPARNGSTSSMRVGARAWLAWLQRQTDADGFRFDAVKHFPPDVVADALAHAFRGRGERYFAVGEYVDGTDRIDAWASATGDRAGTWDFPLRGALADIIEKGGAFDMGSLPRFQQKNRRRTVPFVNNHDTWRGAFWDSANNGSLAHDDRDGDWRQNGDELAPTIDPDNPRAPLAYAAALAVDGNPMVFYEDLFVNYGADRKRADPRTTAPRPYLRNLLWCYQKLRFREGAYKVRFQDSPDLLVIERAGRALVGLNDSGTETHEALVQTDFGPGVRLRDYSGSTDNEIVTDGDGRARVRVPPSRYAVWGPAGVAGGIARPGRRTTQVFEMADDLGDAGTGAPGYGGSLVAGTYRTAGAVWAAKGSVVRVWLSSAAAATRGRSTCGC
jgi:alpha-amylase